MIVFDQFDTPIGVLTIAADAHGLRHIGFPRDKYPADRTGWRQCAGGDTSPLLRNARQQLQDYFSGERSAFDLPLTPQGTVFQLEVWRMLAQIPYGQTWTYRDLAHAIGKPAAVRAVGAANGRNPLPIVLPCHRVIGADGGLTGFGGGLDIKAALLRLEGALPKTEADMPDLFSQ
ncbi:MAG: methylated-DNA--[protein]-cysteine S-methyltransferase [Lysobacteraceae bacterium]|nr:MAG: methylated-DNA--[protein]-cysteine S-methyltransferase [Xanthomonadaceae bacterium]